MIVVMPTNRGKIMLSAAIISLIISFINPGITICMVAACLNGIVVSSLMLAFFSLYKVSLQRGPMRDSYAGVAMNMPVLVINHGGSWRQTLVVKEECPFIHEKIINCPVPPMKPGERCLLNRNVVPGIRGHYYLEKISLIGGDPAGLFRRKKHFRQICDIVIYPETIKISWMPIRIKNQIHTSLAGRPLGVSGIGYDFFGVREYRPSDGVRFIHWKSTARYHQLMVREFEANAVTSVCLMLDINKDSVGNDEYDNNLEFMIKTASSIVSYLAANFCQILFITGSEHGGLMRISGETSGVKDKIMTALAMLKPSETTLERMLNENIDLMRPNTIFYCLTLSESSAVSNCFDMLIDKSIDVRWIFAPAKCFPSQNLSFFGAERGMTTEEFKSVGKGLAPFVAGRNMNIAGMLMYG